MNESEFRKLCDSAYNELRLASPFRSGTLRNSITVEYEGSETCHIYVDDSKAPYMPYTNEPWVSAYWNGKKNPNLYWFDDAVMRVISGIIAKYRGKLARSAPGVGTIDKQYYANKWQNKHGDLMPEHIMRNSMYLESSKRRNFRSAKEKTNGGK